MSGTHNEGLACERLRRLTPGMPSTFTGTFLTVCTSDTCSKILHLNFWHTRPFNFVYLISVPNLKLNQARPLSSVLICHSSRRLTWLATLICTIIKCIHSMLKIHHLPQQTSSEHASFALHIRPWDLSASWQPTTTRQSRLTSSSAPFHEYASSDPGQVPIAIDLVKTSQF